MACSVSCKLLVASTARYCGSSSWRILLDRKMASIPLATPLLQCTLYPPETNIFVRKTQLRKGKEAKPFAPDTFRKVKHQRSGRGFSSVPESSALGLLPVWLDSPVEV